MSNRSRNIIEKCEPRAGKVLKGRIMNQSIPREECGVFGIFGHPEAANLTYLGLYALQHRGQESAGIVTSDHGEPKIYKGMGLVADTFDGGKLQALSGDVAVGHVR